MGCMCKQWVLNAAVFQVLQGHYEYCEYSHVFGVLYCGYDTSRLTVFGGWIPWILGVFQSFILRGTAGGSLTRSTSLVYGRIIPNTPAVSSIDLRVDTHLCNVCIFDVTAPKAIAVAIAYSRGPPILPVNASATYRYYSGHEHHWEVSLQ